LAQDEIGSWGNGKINFFPRECVFFKIKLNMDPVTVGQIPSYFKNMSLKHLFFQVLSVYNKFEFKI
jgi:hypothetical protein